MKGEGNQQDYGMRIYDPRVGRFLSVDPITANYPELAPYQFASNRPISAIDIDGLEAKDLARELEPIRAQREKEKQYGITYPETRNERYLRYFVTGGLGIPLLASGSAAAISAMSASTQVTISGLILWVSNPANQSIVLQFAEGALELINPDPGYNIELFPGPSSGEVVKSFKLLFKTRSGKIVKGLIDDGASFKNLSEVNWFEKLLAEGNDVRLLKANTGHKSKSADFLVNGVKTEIKEISNVTSNKLNDNIKSTIQDAISQAGNNGNIIIDVSKQKGATKEVMDNIIERLKGNSKQNTNYRIVGSDFELTGNIPQKTN